VDVWTNQTFLINSLVLCMLHYFVCELCHIVLSSFQEMSHKLYFKVKVSLIC